MARLTLGVPCTSGKENESRLPIHPHHLERIDADIRASMYLEHGYGLQYGVSDEVIATQVAGMRTREQLLAESDVVLLPKPVLSDLEQMHEGQVLWGWPHAVQDRALAQARDRPAAHPRRVGGDEPLEPVGPVRPARVPPEQRARRVRVGAARPHARAA